METVWKFWEILRLLLLVVVGSVSIFVWIKHRRLVARPRRERHLSAVESGGEADALIPTFTSGHEFVGIRDARLFFESARLLLSPGSIVILEEDSMSEDVESFVDAHGIAPRGRISTGTSWPRTRLHWLPATPEILNGLATLSERHAAPEICDHLYAVVDGRLAIVWYDVFDDPLRVSSAVPEAQVSEFAQAVGIEPAEFEDR